MAGRPQRELDEELAFRLQQWRVESDLSYSFVADRLGVAVTTVMRSLEKKSFSADMKRRVEVLLNESDSLGSEKRGDGGLSVGGFSENDLRFLQKFVKLIPKAEALLRSALRRRAEGVKS